MGERAAGARPWHRRAWGSWPAALTWGLATLVLSLAMGRVFPQELASPPAQWALASPVLAFEFATEPSHLVAIFGTVADPLSSARVAAMDAGNRLDYLFMLFYGSLILAFFGAGGATTGDRRWWLAGWLGPLAAASDAVENALLLSITADMSDPSGELALLPVFVWTKFGLLALSSGLAGWLFIRMRAWPLALLCLPGAVLIVPAILARWTYGELLVPGTALTWLVMLLWAGWRTARKTA
ncbi:MAG: hypothetical protein CL808_08680 [Citromicrobium sp.]|nr:hypothetical protein [Citromicrobium sp.]